MTRSANRSSRTATQRGAGIYVKKADRHSRNFDNGHPTMTAPSRPPAPPLPPAVAKPTKAHIVNVPLRTARGHRTTWVMVRVYRVRVCRVRPQNKRLPSGLAAECSLPYLGTKRLGGSTAAPRAARPHECSAWRCLTGACRGRPRSLRW